MSLLPQRRDARLRGAGRDKGSPPAYSYPLNEACRVALVRRALNRLERHCTLPSISCNAGLASALPLCNKPTSPCRVAVGAIDAAYSNPGRTTWSLGPLFCT